MTDDRNKQSTRDKYREAMERNPKWTEAPKSGRGFVIGAAKLEKQLWDTTAKPRGTNEPK